MYCRTCGHQLADQAVVCVACGCPPAVGRRFCQRCGVEMTTPAATVCMRCGGQLINGQAKSKLVAGLLGIFVGGLGIHRFYLGYTTIGILQIVVTLVTCGVGHLWGVIEGILILAGSSVTTDADGQPLTD